MNILHINFSDLDGGAATAAFRFHQGLLRQGLDSKLLVGHAITTDSSVGKVPYKPRIESNLLRCTTPLGMNYFNLHAWRVLFQMVFHHFQEAPLYTLKRGVFGVFKHVPDGSRHGMHEA